MTATRGSIPTGGQPRPRALDVVGDVMFDLEKRENRKRKRTQKDRQWLWQVGHVLVADLAYHYLSGSPGNGLVVPRAKRELGKKSRYHPPYFTRSFPKSPRYTSAPWLSAAEDRGLLRQAGTIETHNNPSAGARFVELVEKHQVTFEDLEVSTRKRSSFSSARSAATGTKARKFPTETRQPPND